MHSPRKDFGNTILTMKQNSIFSGPLLKTVTIKSFLSANNHDYPFSLDIIKNLNTISFSTQVTFFVGENGTGKSTLLEAIAHHAGFGAEGGSKNIYFKTSQDDIYSGMQNLADQLILSWRQKPKDGYFFRAETFYNVANHLDYLNRECGGAYNSYGGKSLHHQSHGESFLSFF